MSVWCLIRRDLKYLCPQYPIEGERETDRQRQTEKQRGREKQTNRQRQRGTQTDRQAEKQAVRQTDRQTETKRDGEREGRICCKRVRAQRMEGRNVVLRPVNQDGYIREKKRGKQDKDRQITQPLKKNQCLYFASRNTVPLVPRNWLISAKLFWEIRFYNQCVELFLLRIVSNDASVFV